MAVAGDTVMNKEFEATVREALQKSIASTMDLCTLALTAGFQAALLEERKGTNPLRKNDDPDARSAAAFWDNGWEIGQGYLRNKEENHG